MAEDRRLRRYNPGPLKATNIEQLKSEVKQELNKVQLAVGGIVDGVREINYGAPDFKEAAQVIYADGDNYNPGEKEGYYHFDSDGNLVSSRGGGFEVNTASDLTALPNGRYNTVYMRGDASVGDGKQGPFEWLAGDQSTNVSNDTDGDTYKAPDGENGSNGAFKRLSWDGENDLNSRNTARLRYTVGSHNRTNASDWNAANFAYGMDWDADDGAGAGIFISTRLLNGSPGNDIAFYGLKVQQRSAAEDGTDSLESIAFEGRSIINAGVTEGHAEGLVGLVKHEDNTADGKLIAGEFVVENEGTDTGTTSFSDKLLKAGLAVNSDGSTAAFSAIKIAGSLSSGWHHGIAIAAGKLGDSVLWYDNECKLTNDSQLGLGTDNPSADIHIQKTGSREIRQINDTNPGSAGEVCRWVGIARDDTAGGQHTFARIQFDVFNPADGSEKGKIRFYRIQNGTVSEAFAIQAGFFSPSVTGGDPGASKINVADVQISGESCTTSSGTTGGDTSATGHLELTIGGTTYKVLTSGTV